MEPKDFVYHVVYTMKKIVLLRDYILKNNIILNEMLLIIK